MMDPSSEARGRASSAPRRALFRFYEELNDYLPEKARKREWGFDFNESTTVGEAIAALGIPSGEVDLILANGASVSLGHRLRDGERVSVYPIFERLDISGVTRVRAKPLIKLRPIRK